VGISFVMGAHCPRPSREPSWEPSSVDWYGPAVDSSGTGSLQFQSVWTPVDLRGRRLEIYGSEGWGFESLRAC
jgi:hypothetical protein